MKAPVGAMVRIFYDAALNDGRPLDVNIGDVLVTKTRRVYLVIGLRQQQRGKHAGRYHVACLIQSAVPPGARVHGLAWYPRRRRS